MSVVPSTKTSTGTTFGGTGQPMDIGQAWAQGLCFTCHQKGHLSRNCPQKKNLMVRQLMRGMSESDRKAVIEEYVKKKSQKEVPKGSGTGSGMAQGFQAPQQ